jgi:hypothetical protein
LTYPCPFAKSEIPFGEVVEVVIFDESMGPMGSDLLRE